MPATDSTAQSGSLSLWEKARARAFVVLSTIALVPACVAQTQPSTQPSRDERREPDRILTIEECLKRFELDERLSLCHVWETKDGNGLAGFVEQPQYKAVLERATKKEVSRIKLLPEESKTEARFGIVTAEHVILRESPMDEPGDRDNVSDLLLGEPVWILDRSSNGAILVHSSDGYLGWVEEPSIWPVGGDLFSDWLRAYSLSGRWIEHEASTLRDRMPEFLSRRDEKFAKARVEREFRGNIRSGRSRTELVLGTARGFNSTPYLWGGKTRVGIDCSGLTQVAFGSWGIALPRDADQQANVGKLVATRWFKDALLPGDLLFFVSPHRGNVHHVAIYLGEGKYIEAAGPDVHISSMNPADKEYDAERAGTFAWARRVIE